MLDHVFNSRWTTNRLRAGRQLLAWLALCMAAGGLFAADLGKTLHVLIESAETTLDPVLASDISTISVNENIFDPMLRYDYLARPLKLQPNTLVSMPEVSNQNRDYVFHLARGIYFTPDPAFGGKRRELTAEDYVFSFKRFYDPALKSPWLFLFENKIVGDEVLTRQAKQAKFDYDVPVSGLKALDRYTLQIRLKAADANFLFEMAMPAAAAVAREVIQAYGADAGNHPVGTGAFMIKDWQRSSRILLQANPGFRETIFRTGTAIPPGDAAVAAALDGKQLPLIGQVEIKVMEEQQPRVLGFLNREFDYLEPLPAPLADMALTGGKLKPALERQGVKLTLFPILRTYYMWMNMDDPVIGGYGSERVALRRAIALGYNQDEDLRVLEKGLAIAAHSPLPPNVLGYDPAYRSATRYDPVLARALLDRFGYRDRDHDGYRETPDGKPLVLTMHTVASTTGRLRDEFWRRSLDALGLRVVFKGDKYGEIIKASRLGQVQMFETNWVADFPDGENFFQLLYGPNSGRANYARFNLPQYNQLYERSLTLPDSAERTGLYRDMSHLIAGYAPWVLRNHPLSATLSHRWVRNYRRHPVENTVWRYIDIDLPTRDARR